jgi:hypothetical protein
MVRSQVCLDDLRWHPVPGWPGYEANRASQVRSLPRLTRSGWTGGKIIEADGQRVRVPRILKPVYNRRENRYYISLCRDGHARVFYLHTVIATTFLGERTPGLEVCHLDENKLNNWAENLKYDTPEANRAAFLKAGRHHNTRKARCPRCAGPFTVLASGYRRCDPCANKASRAYRERRKSQG